MDGILGSALQALAAGAVGVVLAVAGYFVAKRSGLGPVQAEHVRNLVGNNTALEQRVGILEEALEREKRRRARLARKVVSLERTVVELAEENTSLRKRLDMPKREIRLELDDEDDDELTSEDEG